MEEMRSVKIDDKTYKKLKLENAKTGKKIYAIIKELYDDRQKGKNLKQAYNNLLESHKKVNEELKELKQTIKSSAA